VSENHCYQDPRKKAIWNEQVEKKLSTGDEKIFSQVGDPDWRNVHTVSSRAKNFPSK
jgi:hypothetical protein